MKYAEAYITPTYPIIISELKKRQFSTKKDNPAQIYCKIHMTALKLISTDYKKGEYRMLGVKVKNVTFNKEYTLEELYDAIKDYPFSAGEPSLTKHGMATIITFPPLDRQNQVWVMKVGFKERSAKFSVQKGEQAGVGKMAGNMVLNELTGGIFGLFGAVGKNVKNCEQLVEATAKELSNMSL